MDLGLGTPATKGNHEESVDADAPQLPTKQATKVLFRTYGSSYLTLIAIKCSVNCAELLKSRIPSRRIDQMSTKTYCTETKHYARDFHYNVYGQEFTLNEIKII